MKDIILNVNKISKQYKLYDKSIDRLKESFSIGKKEKHIKFNALDSISFDVKCGETVGIIGKNGAGKSTLLKIITGVLNQTEGTVELRGKVAALLELGAGFNQNYTGIENVFLNGMMFGFTKKEIEDKIDNIIEFADIGDFIYQPVKNYSSGMFVRLAFAVAINVEPDILIIDEALAVGDIFFQNKCYKKFEDFKSKGKTIIFVTHSLDTIINYCDRAILIDGGKKIGEGLPNDIVNLYKQILVEEYEAKGNKSIEKNDDNKKTKEILNWKEKIYLNNNCVEYGNKKAEIIDYGLFDDNGMLTNRLFKGKIFEIKFKIKFNEEIENPIFAYTIKDLKGNEITGTNTLLGKINEGKYKVGEVVEIVFEQKLAVQNMDYLVSLGCTGFVGEELVVYHRLYDLFAIEVISNANTVGFFDIDSKMKIKKC